MSLNILATKGMGRINERSKWLLGITANVAWAVV